MVFDIDGGKAVGWYRDVSNVIHGFLYDGDTYTTIDAPDATKTLVFAIDGDTIAGSVKTASGAYGFVASDEQWPWPDVSPPNPIPAPSSLTCMAGLFVGLIAS